ncbi:MAG: hypothetical protein AAGJ97_05980 [Planctomycetota bacterium]
MPLNSRDLALEVEIALPAAAGSVTSPSIELHGGDDRSDFTKLCELVVELPAFTTAELPDGNVVSVDLIHSDKADLSGAETLYSGVPLVTGANGTGALATKKHCRFPLAVKAYVGIAVTTDAAVDVSAKKATAYLVA